MIKEEKKPELFTIPAETETSRHFERILKPEVAQQKAPSGMSSFFKGNEPPNFQPVRDEKNLNLLLKWVMEGHLEEAKKLLKSKPELALMEGNVTDLSGREFKGITALQYAYWALDAEMMEVIIKYTDRIEVLSQLKSFESNPAKYSTHGLHYDNSVLLQKMTEHLNNYSKWNDEHHENHWQKEIGGAQRMCPAWLVYAMCEEGVDVAWTEKDEKRKVKRQYEKEHLKWWFDKEYNGGKMGEKWGALRGVEDMSCYEVSLVAISRYIGLCIILHDSEVHGRYGKQSVKVVDDLKTQLTAADYYLNLLLKWVVEGHLKEAEELLKSNSNLALMEGDVKDLSGREFKEITALQYAYWVLDVDMMEVVVKYMDKNDALTQIKTFESNLTHHLLATYSTRGVHYNNSVLVQKMTKYLNNYCKWSHEQCASYWQKDIGGAQRMCPAWLVYAMCEEGADVAWTKKDVQRKVKRQYDKEHLKWWFDKEYNGGKMGDKWAAARAWGKHCGGSGEWGEILWVVMRGRKHDQEVHGRFGKQSVKVVEDLKTQLTTNHNNMGKVGKQ